MAAAFPELGIGFYGVALAFGLTVLTMAFAIGHISGCHLNPAVSVGLWAGGRFPASQLLPYIAAQVLGALVAGGVLFVTFFTPALSNYALFQIALALALTLGSVGPLYALPLTYIMQHGQRRPSFRAFLGSALSVAGIVVLAFFGSPE